MSLQNLNKKNNYEFFCKKITVDEYEIDTITVDNINVNTATVLTEITTPHINSGTSLFNTVVTSSLDAASGTILDLNSNAIECDNLTVNNTATINTLNVNTSVTAPTVVTNSITSPTGNISNLTSSNINSTNITAPNANLDTISGTNLTYTNGSITQLNGDNVQYSTGNIGDISGSNLNYDTGYIPTLSTKELTVYSAIVSCPNANIDNLTVNNTITAPVFEAPEMRADFFRSYSAGKTTFQENVVVDTQFNCPMVGVDTVQTNGSGSVTFINPIISPTVRVDSLATTSGFGNISSSNPITCANVNTNVINSTTGGGFINVQRPIVLPNITNSSALAYYSYNTLTLTTSGCIATTLTGFGVRVGNMITVYVQCLPNTTLATSLGVLFITGFPSQYAPNVGSTRGTCLVNSLAGAVFGSYTFTSSGQLNIFSGPNGGGWNVGQPCGLASTAVSGSDYASFSMITNI